MATNINSTINGTMQTANATTTSALSKVNSVFSTSVKENLSVVQATAKDGITALNSFKDEQLGTLNTFIKSVTGNAITMKDLSSIIDVRNGIKIDYDALSKRLSDAAGFPLNSIQGMTRDIQRETENLLDAYSSGNVTRMLNAAGLTFRVNDGSQQLVSMLSDVLSRTSKSDSKFNEVVDESAQLAFLNTMLKYTVTAGLWEGIDDLLEQYTIPEEGIRSLGNYSTIAVKNGDVYTLQAIMDRCGISAITAVNTNLHADLLRYFEFSSDVVETEYPDYRTRMLNVLDAANPTWEKKLFNTLDTLNLTAFTQASDDTIELLGTVDRFRTHILLGPEYPKRALMTLIRNFYPNVAILS